MTRHASLGIALVAAVLSTGTLDALDRRVDEARARAGHAPRVRLLERLKGQPDALKLPRDARREATAGVFI